MKYRIVLKFEGITLTCQISDIEENCNLKDLEFAYYLYKNDKQLDTIWYTKEKKVEFKLEEAGIYYIVVFVKKQELIYSEKRSLIIFQVVNLQLNQVIV